MGRKFKIERDYYDEKDYLYRKNLKAKNWLIKRLKDGILKEKRFV